jgi:hypothetical protein
MVATDFVVSVPTNHEKHSICGGYGAGWIIHFRQWKQNRGRHDKCWLERLLPKSLEYEFGAECHHIHFMFHRRLMTLPQRRAFEAAISVEKSQPFA